MFRTLFLPLRVGETNAHSTIIPAPCIASLCSLLTSEGCQTSFCLLKFWFQKEKNVIFYSQARFAYRLKPATHRQYTTTK